MRKGVLIFPTIAALLLIGGGVWVSKGNDIRARFFDDQPAELPVAVEADPVNENENRNVTVNNENENTNQPVGEEEEPVEAELPAQYNLAVPFVLQAPTANWDEVHNETCEEAAVLTMHYFWTKVKSATAPQIEAEYTKMIAYENKTFGDYKDTTAEQTAKMMKDLYGYKRVDVLPMTDLDDAKVHVAAGRPVIIPSSGKLLKNPNFKNGGPLYHMLVIRGWMADGRIITNDPGTRKGNGYVYNADILWNAIHDWNGGDVTAGEKVMIVVYPNGV